MTRTCALSFFLRAQAQLTMLASVVLLAVTFAAPASAEAGVVGTPLKTCIAPMRPALPARELLATMVGFDCATPQSRYGSGDFDVVAIGLPVGLGRDDPVVLRTASVWLERATLYALYADGVMARADIDQQQMTAHLQLGAMVDYRLPVRQQPVVGLLWRVHGAGNMRGVVLGASLSTPTRSAHANLVLGALYGGFGGLCLALLVYNLALWGALRHRFQLAYCAMVAALAAYALSSSGAIAWAFPTIANNDRIRLNYALLAVAVVAAMSFARTFFERRVFAGWLGKMTDAICASVLSAALVFVVFASANPALLDRFYSASFALVLIAVAPAIARAWRCKSDYLWLFALGWAAPIGFAAARVASNLHFLPYGFWLDNSTLLAMSLEALMSSVAIAYRIHLLSRDRDEAREQEIAARLLAATDPLTGLLNRRAFLAASLGRAGDQLLLLVDIDHFKQVNETIGHDGGDEVLRVIARALRASVPADALIARIGGEEFAVVASANAGVSPTHVLDCLRGERMPFDMTITASIGACVGPLGDEVDWKCLYRQADRALFEAKAAGRDRARHATVELAA